MLAVRHPREVDGMSSVLQVVSSIEQIANAAVDIAKIVLRNIGIPRALVVDLAQAAEVSHRLIVADGSHLANRPLSDMELPVVVGMRVVAIQRGRRWLTDVGGDDIVEAGDALFMRGGTSRNCSASRTRRCPSWVPPAVETSSLLTDLDRAVDTLVENEKHFRDSYWSGLLSFGSAGPLLAREVRALEERLDAMKVSLQTWVLRAAADDVDLSELRGLLHLAEAAEDIGDQALKLFLSCWIKKTFTRCWR